jgi:hypothetical protein
MALCVQVLKAARTLIRGKLGIVSGMPHIATAIHYKLQLFSTDLKATISCGLTLTADQGKELFSATRSPPPCRFGHLLGREVIGVRLRRRRCTCHAGGLTLSA